MIAAFANKTRLNLRLGTIALILALLPAFAFAAPQHVDCDQRSTLDYVINATGDANGLQPISLRPEDQCAPAQQDS